MRGWPGADPADVTATPDPDPATLIQIGGSNN